MHLKSISLLGFKSFTDKTQIKLDGGISCIVGPNGSGKSNIADAVRWVLGEQSAKTLRGQKMEDVIFAGSGQRKALGMAEVALNIDNSDGSLPLEFVEVSVCRRTYRSGESEYLINGKQCRLKDLQELFLDSGISNNSLAMVGQGRVHEIVSMKPEERRSLIEEAAGVIKYRNRKKTAVRKLETTQVNLDRVWDIISDLAERLDPLKEQAEKASRYLTLKEDADSQEINLLLQILAENKEKLELIKTETQTRMDKLIQAETDKTAVDSQIEVIKTKLEESEAALSQVQQRLFDLKTQKEREEAKGVLLQEKLNTAEANQGRIQQEIDLLLNRDDGFVSQVENLENQSREVGLATKELQNAVVAKETDFAGQKDLLEDLKGELELARNEIFDQASQLAHSKNQLLYQEENIKDNTQELKSMTEVLDNLNQDQSQAKDAITALAEDLQASEIKVNADKANFQALEASFADLNRQITETTQKEVASRFKLNSEQSRLKVLSELHDNLEGYYPGVRSLLKAKKQDLPVGRKILGVVAELIEVDSKYSVALEAALAGALQHLVVENDQDAKAAVAYLKSEQLGRATFLPLASLVLRPKTALDKALGKAGVIGRAAQVVNCDPKIKPVVEFLLAHILLVENLDVATKIAAENRQQFKIITLDGDVISPGGSITGGSRQKSSGDLLQKKSQLTQLKNSVAALTKENQSQLAQIAKLKEEEAKSIALKEQQSIIIRGAEIQLITKAKDLDHLKSALNDKSKQQEILANNIKELNLEQQRLVERKSELAQEVAGWQVENEKANLALIDLQKRIETENQVLETKRVALDAEKIVVVKKQQEYDVLLTEVNRLHSEKKDLFAQLDEKRQALADWQTQNADLIAKSQASVEQLKALAAEILACETDFGGSSNQVGSTKEEIQQLDIKSRDLNKDIAVLQQELHQLELKDTRLQTEWESESAKLSEAFELTYEEALSYLDTDLSRRDLARNVKELRREIASLGNVNVDSIAEYQEVSNRHDFLTRQRQDLLDAKASLNKVIKEMDTIMVKRFKEAFDRVNHEFNLTFAKLFGGGSAGLAMTLPDDILETGIDMVVQPPGKKLVNYNLLSGGEKSLIGIALILAIFQVKPSPFCVLDEVDAALDEANVDRFAEYLQDFAVETQFIVVSHRQGTMEAATNLWGVTMEDDGVSKLVSVKLSDNNLVAPEAMMA